MATSTLTSSVTVGIFSSAVATLLGLATLATEGPTGAACRFRFFERLVDEGSSCRSLCYEPNAYANTCSFGVLLSVMLQRSIGLQRFD